jgi:hypothetical protein
MIELSVSVRNPFWKNSMNSLFKTCVCKSWRVSENKTLEFEVNRHFYYVFGLNIDTSLTGKDHAGPNLNVDLFGYSVSIALHDNRHWDDETNDWEKTERFDF